MLKIIFVQPRYFNVWEALGLAYIGSYVREHFQGKVKLSFFQSYFDDDRKVVAAARDCDIIAFSCTSPVFAHAVELAGKVKKANPRVRTVFGGVHPSALPEDCLLEGSVDQVVVGEGENAFYNILLGDAATIVKGKKSSSFTCLFPDRELIRNGRTIELCEKMIGLRSTSFQSVRVCPFRCAFCAERVVTGTFNRETNPLLERDPVHIVEEIRQVAKRYRLDYFKFVDATWNTSFEKVAAFCEEKVRRKLDLPWEANVHASLATKEMLAMMKRAGCRQINVGCESGSPRILRDMRKGLVVEKIKNVFDWGRQLGIERRAFFLLGMPNENREDIRMTEKLVKRIRPEVFGVTLLCPYPGTDFYNAAAMRDYDWSVADEYSNPYWETPHFTNAELKAFQKDLIEKFADTLTWHNRLIKNGTQKKSAKPSD